MREIRKLTPVMHKVHKNPIIQCSNTKGTAYGYNYMVLILE
jgi:hypothetical protein